MQFWRLGCVSQSVFFLVGNQPFLSFIHFVYSYFFYFPSLFYWFISGSKRSIFFEKKWIPNSRITLLIIIIIIIINHTWILFIFPFLKHIWEWRKKWFSSNSSVWFLFLLLLFVFVGLLVCLWSNFKNSKTLSSKHKTCSIQLNSYFSHFFC